eukprot:1177019-Prorocentrum_minimum.AAC.7
MDILGRSSSDKRDDVFYTFDPPGFSGSDVPDSGRGGNPSVDLVSAPALVHGLVRIATPADHLAALHLSSSSQTRLTTRSRAQNAHRREHAQQLVERVRLQSTRGRRDAPPQPNGSGDIPSRPMTAGATRSGDPIMAMAMAMAKAGEGHPGWVRVTLPTRSSPLEFLVWSCSCVRREERHFSPRTFR